MKNHQDQVVLCADVCVIIFIRLIEVERHTDWGGGTISWALYESGELELGTGMHECTNSSFSAPDYECHVT